MSLTEARTLAIKTIRVANYAAKLTLLQTRFADRLGERPQLSGQIRAKNGVWGGVSGCHGPDAWLVQTVLTMFIFQIAGFVTPFAGWYCQTTNFAKLANGCPRDTLSRRNLAVSEESRVGISRRCTHVYPAVSCSAVARRDAPV